MSLQHSNTLRLASDNEGESSVIVFPVCVNPLLRLGLETILAGAGFSVWHDTVDGFSSLPSLQDETSALFIIDGSIYASAAIDLIRRLRAHAPAARIVVLADAFEPGTITAAWDAGADGFCLSTQKHDVFIKSLELVMLGEAIVPAAVILPVAEEAHCGPYEPAEELTAGNFPDVQSCKLSGREAEILTCLKEGAPNKVIARKLNLSEATVKVHVKAILRKVGVCNRTQAALWATRHALAGPRGLRDAEDRPSSP